MERNTTEPVAYDSRDETVVGGGVELSVNQMCQYVQQNPTSTNVKLFSFLAMLNAYIPESYLLMSECQMILGPPDPIHGGPPFEERMQPFTDLIKTNHPNHGCVCMIDPAFAQTAVERLADLRISRSATVNDFMFLLCGDQPEQHIIQFIKDLLIMRKIGKKGKDKFSKLIEDILDKENFHQAVSVLETASDKFNRNPNFPQTIARLYYSVKDFINYERSEEWAKTAIRRAPNNSYVADTLGQIHKNRLLRTARQQEDIIRMTKEALKAFKDEEEKADREEGPELGDMGDTVSLSDTFNNRGRFGFIQVAKIAFEKLSQVRCDTAQNNRLIQSLKVEVEDKFDFFEWYLTYSKPDMTILEPHYFWKDIVLCYKYYTTKDAAESTSFAGLLDCLNHGLLTSKGSSAGFEETKKTESDLEAIQDDLKTTYEENVDDVKAAERYILSNIILSNKMPNSLQLTPVTKLQAIIHTFLGMDVGRRSPEFHLLVLLLFWPEEQPPVVQQEEEEVEQQATEDDESENQTSVDDDIDEGQKTSGKTAQLSLELSPDLQQQVTFMERVYQRSEYAKYLRGRYLLPLFFLGKGSGLSKWIHKSRLDAIVENKVDAELDQEQDERNKKKWELINKMWISGGVWHVPEIQDILLPVQVEPCLSPVMPQEHEDGKVFVCTGGKRIIARVEIESDNLVLSTMLFYLGFTIEGPVVFKVGPKSYQWADSTDTSPECLETQREDEDGVYEDEEWRRSKETFLKIEQHILKYMDWKYLADALQRMPPELKLKCGAKDSSDWIKLEPIVNQVEGVQTHRLQSYAGHFECSVSALRWVCKEKVSFKYQFCSWEEHRERTSCVDYMPAGPLLDITVSAGKLEEVHLPHWICVDDNTKDMFAVLHVDTCGDYVESVSEVTSSHVKLFQPVFSPRGAMILKKLGIPVKVFYETLIYKTTKANLTMHIYLVPPDPVVQQAVEREEKSDGSKRIKKPSPDKPLQMEKDFFLSTDVNTAEIIPDKLKLTSERRKPNFFEVFIRDAESDFSLKLEIQQKRGTDTVWTCTIRTKDYQRKSTDHEHAPGQHFVDRHRTALINRVTDTGAILDELKDVGLISGEAYNAVRALDTTEDQMRDIIKFVTSAGERGKDALYGILKGMSNLMYLMSDLEGPL